LADAVIVAAPSSGSGKTLITLAVLRALKNAGVRVSAVKIGPDYIDPRFLEAATGRPCLNVDPWAMRPALVTALLAAQDEETDLLVIEGVMGLFDGPEKAKGSTADVAKQLGLPVLLVIDASRQSQSIAALVHGFSTFRKGVSVAGVILNRIGSERHHRLLASALPQGLVVGAVPRLTGLEIPSRHLGLQQARELQGLEGFIAYAPERAGAAIDLDKLKALARPLKLEPTLPKFLPPLGQRIAVANDDAFGFSYEHMLAAWRAQGAELRFFSPLADKPPAPDADAVFLPGGYPELHAARLAANSRFLDGLSHAATRGALIYGECGGYMVLGRYLIDAQGKSHPMAALLPHATSFADRKLSLGYRRLKHKGALPFPLKLRGHEFHYSTVAEQVRGDRLFTMHDASGELIGPAGLRNGLIMGYYAHVIDREDSSH
jgi:cobyrinic acid a,c-diamide synthase